MQQQPAFRQIFWQTWRDLVFVHWEVDPAALERLLPPELEPDLFEGKAYVALVPFRMTGIRSVWLPPIPGTARTLETNVRTYVRRRGVAEPVPAVWFFSLEAESTLAVRVARGMYGLPYFKARMEYEREVRGAGDTIFPGILTVVLSWTVIVGGGHLMVRFFPQLEATGPWIAATAYIAILGVVLAIRFERGAWKRVHLLDGPRGAN